ncbi:Hypothetical protein NTJ_08244 [Nesidiocoris tenuis]|uniref:Peptidase S1 domain-containing protein n=1 Tax=Nesidiocoris tenuis TaxID=355587 RepID=A0ABN7ATA5_9HEMI|nr:Hypothetical protein NTJ_08244 [Nesidiocoris tenuis]
MSRCKAVSGWGVRSLDAKVEAAVRREWRNSLALLLPLVSSSTYLTAAPHRRRPSRSASLSLALQSLPPIARISVALPSPGRSRLPSRSPLVPMTYDGQGRVDGPASCARRPLGGVGVSSPARTSLGPTSLSSRGRGRRAAVRSTAPPRPPLRADCAPQSRAGRQANTNR